MNKQINIDGMTVRNHSLSQLELDSWNIYNTVMYSICGVNVLSFRASLWAL